MKDFKATPTSSQLNQINELLGINESLFSISDIFRYLPEKIIYNGESGYLRISKIDIVYSSLETEMKGHVVLMFQYLTSDIFDAFIRALKWIKDHNNGIYPTDETLIINDKSASLQSDLPAFKVFGINSKIYCPKCGNTEVEVHSGMFLDRYVCKQCGYESYSTVQL